MELRRVQETGGGTFLISLPKAWAKRSGLNRGSVVAVTEREDGCLTIDPRYGFEKGVETTTISPSPRLKREITGKYLLGFDVIRIEGKGRISPDVRKRVKAAARPLVGLEIIEEGVYKIVLQCLLEPSAFPPDKILRREHLLAAGMHRDVITAFVEADSDLAKAVIERDEEVNRLYFLLVRLLRTMILNPCLSEKMGLHPIDCLDYRLVAGFVESIGDHATEIARNIISFCDTSLPKEVLDAVSRLSDLSYEMHENAMRAIFSRDVDLAEGTLKKRVLVKELIRKLDELLAEQPNMIPYISAVVSSLSRICDYGVDMADLVMPR